MIDAAQICALLHDLGETLRRGVGRAVIDVDDFVSPAAVERGRDFADQRRHVAGLVTHGHDDGKIDNGCIRRWQINAHGFKLIGRGTFGPEGLSASAYYGANALRATLLRWPSEGPASGSIAPSRRMVKARWRAANQYRTSIAPITPSNAPATTSLGWCASRTRRLAPISTA